MKKIEIINHAARLMGDTSAAFVADIVAPNFELVMLDLAQRDCLRQLRRATTFTVEEDKRIYDTREVTQLTPHFPTEICSLTVYAWAGEAIIPMAPTAEIMREYRASAGEDHRGRWDLWFADLTPGRLEVWPPASAAEHGAECEVVFIAPPTALRNEDDVLEIHVEDVPTVVHGLRFLGSGFKEDLVEKQESQALYEQGARRIWARTHNGRPGRIQPMAF